MEGKGGPFTTGVSEKMVRTPLGKIAERVKEIGRLRSVLSQPDFTPEQIFNSGHRRLIVVAAGELRMDSDELLKGIAGQICGLPGFSGALAEQVYEAVAAKMLRLEEQVEEERSRRDEAAGGSTRLPAGSPVAAKRAIGSPQRIPEGPGR
jgi:hypothetical protein